MDLNIIFASSFYVLIGVSKEYCVTAVKPLPPYFIIVQILFIAFFEIIELSLVI